MKTAGALGNASLGLNGAPPAIGGPTTSSWREDALARIAELEMLTIMARVHTVVTPEVASEIEATIHRHLETAKATAEQRSARKAGIAGADVTRVLTNIHAAESDLLRLAPTEYLLGQLSTLQAYVREHLPARDPRRAELEAIVRSAAHNGLAESQRGAIVAAAREANAEARREVTRVRSFRNVSWSPRPSSHSPRSGSARSGSQRPTRCRCASTRATRSHARPKRPRSRVM